MDPEVGETPTVLTKAQVEYALCFLEEEEKEKEKEKEEEKEKENEERRGQGVEGGETEEGGDEGGLTEPTSSDDAPAI